MLFSLLRWIKVESMLFRTVPSFCVSVAMPAPVTTTSPICKGFGMRAKSRVTLAPGSSAISAVWGL